MWYLLAELCKLESLPMCSAAALIKEAWDKLPRSCREETYTRVMSGRMLQFFYDRFDASVSSSFHLSEDDGIAFCLLRALEEVCDKVLLH